MTGRRVARVLLDSPLPQLDRLFDYAIPAELEADAVPGVRVRVPLRSAGRTVDGYLVEVAPAEDPDRPLSDLEAVVSPVRVLPDALYRLARRAADRAAGSAADILRLVVPKRMVRAEKTWLARPAAPVPEPDPGVVAWARTILDAYPGLADAVAAGERVALDAPPRPAHGEPPVGAWAVLLAAAAIETWARGRSAILVAPDHRDLAQLEAVLASRLPEGVLLRADAGSSGPERYAAYLRLLEARPSVVIGNRSAVYAPAHDTGLVVVWDDGDPLLGEPLSPGVHARDAALVRQELEGSALVVAGHTRTTDAARLVERGWMREVPAARRLTPRVVLSPPGPDEARTARLPSAAYAAAREAVRTGPVLVQVARPGYVPALVCADCRNPARCAHCGGPLRRRRDAAAPECAWCGRSALGWRCAVCEGRRFRMASVGSERTADELGRAFPGVRVIVSDRDHVVTEVTAAPALVVATRGAEPRAVGGYRAVLLLDGDRMLLAEELRIAESCLRWWSNAAALAAPGAPVHLVGVTGPVARALATWTQPAYARAEVAERAAVRMPPAVRFARVEGPRAAVDACLAALRADVPALAEADVLGPVDVPDDPPGPGARSLPRRAAARDSDLALLPAPEAVGGPVPADRGGAVRAVVRFDYALGAAVAQSLRASVVASAVRARGRGRDRAASARSTLRVRLDVPDLDL